MNEFLRTILFLPRQASTISKEIDYLHFSVILITMAGATLITVVGGIFLLKYYRRQHPPQVSASEQQEAGEGRGKLPRSLEFFVFGGLLTLFVVWWYVGFNQYVKYEVPPEDTQEVYVTGKKWMWSFAYPEGITTNTVLYVPVGQPMQLILSSRDVIHSFYVPAFRLKRDVVPGRTTTLWFEATEPGEYDLFCAEYCGEGHSTMRGRVVALSAAEYEAWLDEQRQAPSPGGDPGREPTTGTEVQVGETSMVEMGERVAVENGCLRCHTTDGSPHIGPTWAGAYGSTVRLDSGETVIADEGYLTESMMDPLAKLHLGFQPVMPAYQGTLTVGEVGALVEYIRSLRDVEAQPHVPNAWLTPELPPGAESPDAPPGGDVPPEPLGPMPPPRQDVPPYEPPATEEGP